MTILGKKRADGEGTYYHEIIYDKKTGKKIKDLWRYTIIVNGVPKSFSASPKNGGKTAAKVKYDEWRDKHSDKPVIIAKDVTVREWAIMYIEATKKGNVTDDWYKQLECFINALPKPLQSKKTSDIVPIDIKNALNTSCRNKSKSYSDKMATFLRSMFREASDNGICQSNPAKELRNLKKVEQPRQSYSFDEALKVIEFAATYRQDCAHKIHREFGILIGVAVITMLTTGLRRGELLGLMWTDLASEILTINRAVYMKTDIDGKQRPAVEEYKAKTETSLRTIPIPEMTASAIDSLPHHSEYIFASVNGSLIIPRNFNRAYTTFIRDLRKANPDLPERHPHECRHTFATVSLDKGANLKVLQLLLGHKKMETTARYLHPDFKELKNTQKSTWGGLNNQ